MLSNLKDKGNALAKAKQWSKALVKYTKAIDSVDHTADIDLQAVLHTNRALCHLKLKDYSAAALDCTAALELPQIPDVRAVKALFRRAQARSEMEPPRLALALKDLKSVLSIDSTNKPAQKLWQTLTEKVRQQPAPVVAALDQLRLGPATVTSTTDSSSSTTSNNNNHQLLRWVLGQTFDETEAKELIRKNVVQRLWERMQSSVVSPKDHDLLQHKDVGYALRTLANLCNHESLKPKVCAIIGDPSLATTVSSWCWIFQHCPTNVLPAVLYCMEGVVAVGEPGRIAMLQAMTQRLNAATTRTTGATGTTGTAAPTKSEEVTPILRALVKWGIADQKTANEFTAMNGVNAVIKCADPEDGETRGMVALCMGRIFAAYGDDEVVKTRVKTDILPLLHPSKGALINANGAAALLCVFMVNVSVGVWAVQSSGSSGSSESKGSNNGSDVVLNQLGQLAVRGSALSQTMVVSIFAHMVNDESGRAVVAQEPTMNVLHLLMNCDTPAVRAGAAVAISKAKAIETKFGFKADTEEGAYLLESVSKMLSERLPEKQRTEELAMRVQGIEALSYLMSSTIAKESIVSGASGGGRSSGGGRNNGGQKKEHLTVLQSLIQLAKDDELTNETSTSNNKKKDTSGGGSNSKKGDKKHSCGYGLACIFRDLTMSKQAKARDKLREMDVTEEQWEQFKKLTKSGNDNPMEQDTPEMVQRRVQKVVEAGGISALVTLAESPNETSSMREALGQTLSNMAIVPSARGLMVQQGCLKPLVRLAGYGLDEKGNDIGTMEKMDREREAAVVREERRKKREQDKKDKEEGNVEKKDDAVKEEQKKTKKEMGNKKGQQAEENVASVMQGENSVESKRTKQTQMETTTKTRHLAGQALARILISTNPEMLPLSRVMDSIKPLLALIRTSRDNLMEYEGLMALTNILSMGNQTGPKERFVTLRGIPAVEYCQFSSHPQVRTAATECFVNVVYHINFIKYMLHNNGERFKLWISFAECFNELDEDGKPASYKNARAAMGGLAMMAEIPQLAMVMCEHGCVESMISIMSNSEQDELHMRAAVCLRAMCCVEDTASKKLEEDDDMEENEVVEEAKKRDSETDGNPKLALQILAGYEHTAHYDDMNKLNKQELLDGVEGNEKWYEEEKVLLETTKNELIKKKQELVDEQNSPEDHKEEESDSTQLSGVEITVLEEGEGEEDSKANANEEKETKKALPKPKVVPKKERIERIEKKLIELESTRKQAMQDMKDAEKEVKSSKRALLEWSPEVWKGGIGVMNAFTKIPQVGEQTKQILQECLTLLSDRL